MSDKSARTIVEKQFGGMAEKIAILSRHGVLYLTVRQVKGSYNFSS